MAEQNLTPMDRIAPLMARYLRLDEFYQGYLDGYVNDAIRTLSTGLDLVERMQADKRARTAPLVPKARLRVVPKGGHHG